MLVDADKPGLFGLQMADLVVQRVYGCVGVALERRAIVVQLLREAFQFQQVLLLLLGALFTRTYFLLRETNRIFERTQTTSKFRIGCLRQLFEARSFRPNVFLKFQ